MGNVLTLLAGQSARHPGLADLAWDIQGQRAKADLERLARMYREPDPDRPGTSTLVIQKAPPTAPWIERLHADGWKRRTLHASGPGWLLCAFLEDGDASLTVLGFQLTLPDGRYWEDAESHSATDYFSPEPPPLGRSKAAQALSKEYMDRLGSGDWDGWTATPFIAAKEA
jgi:hypothetical protein